MGYHPEGNNADHFGMTIRDYFAAAALPVAWKVYESWDVNAISKATYQLADAMLKAREAKP
jgi:hypothetical protein